MQTYLSNFTPRITACIQELLKLFELQAKLAGDGPFAAKELVNLSILDVSSAISFGETMQSISMTTDLIRGLDHAPATDARGGITFPTKHAQLVSDADVIFDTFGQITTSSVPSCVACPSSERPLRHRTASPASSCARDRNGALRPSASSPTSSAEPWPPARK